VIRFLIRRLAALIPSVIGISLVTFVLVNLSMTNVETISGAGGGGTAALGRETAEELGRVYGLHLPLFFNPSIEDVRTRTEADLALLEDESTRGRAVRSLARTGGAALPYLVPALADLDGESRSAALDALDIIAPRIGVDRALEVAPDRAAFWTRFWDVYGSDFTPVRAARLVRRLIRRNDQLALSELRRLDTFCLSQLMAALGEDLPASAQARLVDLACELSGREDDLDLDGSSTEREIVISRWQEWWNQRYDMYTSFDGIDRVTGAITETRYFRWLGRMVTLDFGVSVRDGRPVRSKLAELLPVTVLLSFLALLAAYSIAIPLGMTSAVRRDGVFDRATTVILFVLYSLPAFWVAMLLLRYLGSSGHLDLFPPQGLSTPGSEGWPWWRRVGDTAHHLVLPVMTLSFVSMAMLARYQRVGMLRVIERDFMRTARAKGLGRVRAIVRHGLRNGVIPVVTMLGLQLPYLVSGSVVVERIFGIPGMGLETFEAIRTGDHAWLTAVVTVTAVLTVFGVVLSDVIYALVDPRIVPGRRTGGQQ
jgi:peptide/nickel transport system permease protein